MAAAEEVHHHHPPWEAAEAAEVGVGVRRRPWKEEAEVVAAGEELPSWGDQVEEEAPLEVRLGAQEGAAAAQAVHRMDVVEDPEVVGDLEVVEVLLKDALAEEEAYETV